MIAGAHHRRLDEAVQVVLILLVLIVMMVPIFWMVSAAFKRHVDVFQLKLWFEPTLQNFIDITRAPYRIQDKFLNSSVIAAVTVAIAIPLGTMAAYGFSRSTLRRLGFPAGTDRAVGQRVHVQ